jgi:cellulose synthase (UDP-forming)
LNVARAASVLALVAGAVYLAWRTPQVAGIGPLGVLVYAAEVVNYLAFALVAVLVWKPRWRQPPPRWQGTLDVLIPVCGEDPRIVEHNIRAAMAIEYPHRTIVCNDGRLTGKPDWVAIDVLCAELGVTCITRRTGRPGKAGNLNNALQHSDAEIVAVVDADHEARTDLGALTMGHFADPRTAFVATKQSFVVESRDTLGQQELFFYDSLQPAKDSHNAAFSCGNGALYRRAALDDIGGFSEWNVVEDLTTSYELHARGWRSAYVPTRATVGLAPLAAAEYSRQRLRWATDGLSIFFWDNPLLKRGLTLRQRLHYLHTTGWYLAGALYMAFLAAPVAWALFDVRVIRVDSGVSYLLHLLPYLLALGLFMVAHAGWRGALRPLQSQLYLAPVYALAIVYALLSLRVGGVTSKGREARINLPMVLQQVVLVALLVATGVGLARNDPSDVGVLIWASLLAAALANPGTMVTRRRDDAQALRVAVTSLTAVAAGTMVLATWAPSPGAFLVDDPAPAGAPAAAKPAPRTALRPPRTGAYLGVHNHELLRPGASLADWEADRGAHLRIVHAFHDWWGPGSDAPTDWMRSVGRQGAAPMITWEPWRKPEASVQDPYQRPAVLSEIASGTHDRYVTRFARAIAAYRRPVLIRLAHEMNGSWYPWSIGVGSNTPRTYVRAWRHVHRIFDRAGAVNASWVWSIESFAGGAPTPRAELQTYYPGDRYVDWVGLSGFNWGQEHSYGGSMTFREIFTRVYGVVTGFGKPVMVAETGTAAEGDGAAWVRDALDSARSDFPRIKALVFYDARHPAQDFRLGKDGYVGLRDAARTRFWRPAPRLVKPAADARARLRNTRKRRRSSRL